MDSLNRAQYAAMALEAVSMPETVDELGGDNIHAAIYIILRSLRAELDQVETEIRKAAAHEH